jgi:hypothetical protein
MRTILGSIATLLYVTSSVAAAAPATSAPAREAPPVKVTHRPPEGDWSVAQTANFRIYHRQSRVFAEKMAQTAERTRTALLEKWFSEEPWTWAEPCELYLYDNPHEYSVATAAPPQSPAHTRIDTDGVRILSRRIHLHGANAEMLRSILPHEVTHAVLAGRFGQRIPRWADEGMAVLTEPSDRIASHLHLLPHWRDQGLLLNARRLLELEDYPEPRAWGSFYAQSVSLVQFLCKEKGPQTFASFLRDGLKGGYSIALRRYYGWDFTELESRWQRHAFPDDENDAR